MRYLLPHFLSVVIVFACFFHSPAIAEESPAATPEEAGYKHFETWLDEFRAEASKAGIADSVLEDAFADLEEPLEDVIDKDRNQPETKTTFPEYINNVITDRKLAAAHRAWAENRRLLSLVEDKYDVPAQVLLALWGMESNFGKLQGKHLVVDSLATLAYDGRRSQFFRDELLAALRILQGEHLKSRNLLGSWAGAMGQVQFMPSSFLKYAVDFNGDGKKDIWKHNGDALASMANYLHDKGWNSALGWGVPVALPEDSKKDWRAMKEPLSFATWKKFGLRQKNGEMLQGVREEARLIFVDDNPQRAYLVYKNFDILLDWNRSTYFAMSIGMFADALGDEP